MRTLNRKASEILRKYQVHACTDVTGFGLLGHLGEMVEETSHSSAGSESDPLYSQVRRVRGRILSHSGGDRGTAIICRSGWSSAARLSIWRNCFFDPQTSGGLLACLDPKEAEKALEEIENLGLPCGIIGTIEKKREKKYLCEVKEMIVLDERGKSLPPSCGGDEKSPGGSRLRGNGPGAGRQ